MGNFYPEFKNRYNFIIKGDMVDAISKLEELKVDEYRNKDFSSQDSFDKVWFSVLHEVDMFEEGEETQLKKRSIDASKRWLEKYKYLCKEVPNDYR